MVEDFDGEVRVDVGRVDVATFAMMNELDLHYVSFFGDRSVKPTKKVHTLSLSNDVSRVCMEWCKVVFGIKGMS